MTCRIISLVAITAAALSLSACKHDSPNANPGTPSNPAADKMAPTTNDADANNADRYPVPVGKSIITDKSATPPPPPPNN